MNTLYRATGAAFGSIGYFEAHLEVPKCKDCKSFDHLSLIVPVLLFTVFSCFIIYCTLSPNEFDILIFIIFEVFAVLGFGICWLVNSLTKEEAYDNRINYPPYTIMVQHGWETSIPSDVPQSYRSAYTEAIHKSMMNKIVNQFGCEVVEED